MNLALFDFDGTVTTQDTFTPFIHYAIPTFRRTIGAILLSPMILAYKKKFIGASSLRQKVCQIGFAGRKVEEVRVLGESYARNFLPTLIRQQAKDRIAWHRQQGDRIVLVSASLDVYLTEWCQANQIELICTELEIVNGHYTGHYQNGDCTGIEKARRICQRYQLQDYPIVYAYGDTSEDHAMLELAHEKIYGWRPFDSGEVK